MHDAIYFPIHRAKKGEITGTGHLSPGTLTRVRPTFEVQKPGEENDVPLSEYLAGVALELSEAWDHRLPLFVDFPKFAPDDRTPDGKHCIEYFFRCLRQHGMLAIPMTGPESVRGPGYSYLEAVKAVAQVDGRGAAIRLPIDEFNDRGKLGNALRDTLGALNLEPASIDVFLDVETIAFLPQQYRSTEGLVSLLLELLQYLAPTGFRNIVICGSCIPENVDKRYDGQAMRVERSDLLAWQILVGMFGDVLIKRGDSGVIFALEQDVSGPARPPARIRLSTPREYVLWRAPRKDYLEPISKLLSR
jgi:Beta protein